MGDLKERPSDLKKSRKAPHSYLSPNTNETRSPNLDLNI